MLIKIIKLVRSVPATSAQRISSVRNGNLRALPRRHVVWCLDSVGEASLQEADRSVDRHYELDQRHVAVVRVHSNVHHRLERARQRHSAVHHQASIVHRGP